MPYPIKRVHIDGFDYFEKSCPQCGSPTRIMVEEHGSTQGVGFCEKNGHQVTFDVVKQYGPEK